MSRDPVPPWNLPPNAVPWARWIQERVLKLTRDAEREMQSRGNETSAQSGTIKVLGQLIAELRGDVENSLLSLDMSQIKTGDLDQSRVVGTWTKGVDTSGAVNADAGLTSLGAASLDVTTLPGTRHIVWIHEASGQIGQTASTRAKKELIDPADFTAEQFLSVMPWTYWFKAQLAIRDDPGNPHYNPEYEPPAEVGLIAEDLVEAGLSAFVQFDAQGKPANIDYATFSAVAALVIGRSHEERLQTLERKAA